MVAGFTKAFDAELRAAAAADGLTVRQVVTLASLVEKETAAAAEAAPGGRRVSQSHANPHGHAEPIQR